MAKKKKGYQRGRTVNPRSGARRKPKTHGSSIPILQRAYAPGQHPLMTPIDPANPPRVHGSGPSDKPGGSAAGGVVENYNDQVKRKYGGGKL